MIGIGRGITKEGPDVPYNIIHISFAQFIPVYMGLAQARPNHIHYTFLCLLFSFIMHLLMLTCLCHCSSALDYMGEMLSPVIDGSE